VRALCGFVCTDVTLVPEECWVDCEKMIAHVLSAARQRMQLNSGGDTISSSTTRTRRTAATTTTATATATDRTGSCRQGGFPRTGMQLDAVGVGAGTKDFPHHPNIVRLLVGSSGTTSTMGGTVGCVDVTSAGDGGRRSRSNDNNVSNNNDNNNSSGDKNEHIQTQTQLHDRIHDNDNTGNSTTTSKIVAIHPPHEHNNNQPTNELWNEENMILLQANLDDITSELAAAVVERLLQLGACDAWLSSITMKKSRLAMELNVLCRTDEGEKQRLLSAVFAESTTIGVRIIPIQRAALRREVHLLQTPTYGPIQAKVSFLGGQAVTVKPEYDDCARAVTAGATAVGNLITYDPTAVTVKDVMLEAQYEALHLKKQLNER